MAVSGQTPQNDKLVALAIGGGFSARYFLRSGLLERLLNNNIRVLILTPNPDEEYFRQEFSHPNIYIEKLELERIRSYLGNSRWEALLRVLRDFCLDTYSVKVHHKQRRSSQAGGRVKARLLDLAISIFRRSAHARKTLLALETVLFNPKIHQAIFQQYKPDLLVCGSMGLARFPTDALLLREAKSYGVRTLSATIGWDHLSTKGWRGATPDYAAAWSSKMKQELVKYHNYPAERCFITGPTVFDVHFRDASLSREELLRRMKLDPDRKTILFYTWAQNKYAYHADIIHIIGEAMQKGLFNAEVQLVVRLHFPWNDDPNLNDFVKLCESYPNVVVDNSEILSQRLHFDIPRSESERLSALIRYGNVMLSLFSTAAVEACIHDVPVVNICFYGYAEKPSSPDGDLVTGYQYFAHLQGIKQAGATRIAYSPDELINYINLYLDNPCLDHEGRLKVVEQECEYLDGCSADRLASVIKEIVGTS